MSQTKGDEISRAFFVSQLRTLFDESDIDDRLRQQVDAFLSSVNSFLDLLLAVRNLPEGEEVRRVESSRPRSSSLTCVFSHRTVPRGSHHQHTQTHELHQGSRS